MTTEQKTTDLGLEEIETVLHAAHAEMHRRAATAPGHPPLGTIAPGTPVYRYPVSPWRPWVFRAGGAGAGTCIAAAVTVLFGSPLAWWASATAIAMALLFAFVLAGHELHLNHPTRFSSEPQ